MIRTRWVSLAAIFVFLAAVASSSTEHNPNYVGSSVLAVAALLFIVVGLWEAKR